MTKRVKHKFINGIELKRCKFCQKWLSLDKFHKDLRPHGSCWDKLQSQCKICANKKAMRFYFANQEKLKERSRNYRNSNLEKARERNREYRRNNLEKCKAACRHARKKHCNTKGKAQP